MTRPNRLGTAVSMLAIAAVLTGCAAGGTTRESIFGSKVDRSNIGLATRAKAALSGGDVQTAVELAERAVQNTPNDAGFRALLGNAYFAAGRFVSAESAYRDSLSLLPPQPPVILKLALVQIAQGKNAQALAVLEEARDVLDPADYGLAVALAGRADDAVAVLNQAARMLGADARVRQNLALAYGLSGDWTMARTVAAQDVPADQLDARLQQWMAMATPSTPSAQVAALTGVAPAAVDPGQPVRLALHRAEEAPRQAEAADPQPQPQAQPQVAAVPVPAPVANPQPMPAPAAEEIPAPAVAEAVQQLVQPAPQPEPEAPAAPEPAVTEPTVAPAVAPKPELPTRFDAPVQTASYVAISDTVRRVAERSRKAKGNSKSVVQLGAYSSPQRLNAAWSQLVRRYPALRDYTPMRARFDGPKGRVWRLSIRGFASQNDARDRCQKLQSRGGSCFVRSLAGDSPVQFASR